jgi:hypothetical protein
VHSLPQLNEAAHSTAMHHRTDLPPVSTEYRAPARMPGQVSWTRLGRVMGFTNSRAKRAAIRAVMTNLIWFVPEEITDVLDAAPLRYVVAALLGQRRPVAAATTRLSGIGVGMGRDPTLIGLQSDTQEGYVLLDLGYEVVYLLRETPAVPHAASELPGRAMGRGGEAGRNLR